MLQYGNDEKLGGSRERCFRPDFLRFREAARAVPWFRGPWPTCTVGKKTGRRRVSDADLPDKPRLMFMQGLIPYALE